VKKPEEYIRMEKLLGGVKNDKVEEEHQDYGLYEKDYLLKMKVWTKNETKKIDSQLQKLNFKALT